MSYIFLDESGQFNKDGKEQYFVVGAFTANSFFPSWTDIKQTIPLMAQIQISSEVKIPI